MKKLLIIVNLLVFIFLITNLMNMVFNNLTTPLIVMGIILLLPISFFVININRLLLYSKDDYIALAEKLNIMEKYTEFTSVLHTKEMKINNDAENVLKLIQKNVFHYFCISIFGIGNGILCYLKLG